MAKDQYRRRKMGFEPPGFDLGDTHIHLGSNGP